MKDNLSPQKEALQKRRINQCFDLAAVGLGEIKTAWNGSPYLKVEKWSVFPQLKGGFAVCWFEDPNLRFDKLQKRKFFSTPEEVGEFLKGELK